MEKRVIDLLDYLPKDIISGKNQKEQALNVNINANYLDLSYQADLNVRGRPAKLEFSTSVLRYISWSKETFEVFGLLQAEMGKSNNGCLVFANCEHQIINKVMIWFKKELDLDYNKWRWYTKVNINEPRDLNYKKEIEDKIINHWLNKTKVNNSMKHPKTVTYVKDTKNKILPYYNYGTLIIEYKSNLFSQIIKNLIKNITIKISTLEEENIRNFMCGILAGEGSVVIHKESKHYCVHISATKEEERIIYQKCLARLGIEAKCYKDYKEMLISKKENNIQLLKQRLMTISHKKYTKFLYMMQLYPGIKEKTQYFKEKGKNVWNKVHQEKIDQILYLYRSGIVSTKEIANKVVCSQIKVYRILKENNLGKRQIKTNNEKLNEIKLLLERYPTARLKNIAKLASVNQNVVSRLKNKLGIKKSFINYTNKERIFEIN